MKALVLAGGFAQIELLKKLKNRGYTTVLADYNAEPVAKPYADIFYRESTLDVMKIKEIAIAEKVDFLITVCTDQALMTVAQVSEELGLPCYIDSATAKNVTNKAYMKKVFESAGVPTSKCFIMESLDESLIKGMDYPLIVKPVDCNSSKGVKKVENIEQLRVAFADAVNFSRSNTALVEEFVEGPEYSVDVYVEGGVAKVLSISNSEKIPEKDKFVIFRGAYPAVDVDLVIERIKEVAQKIADGFGLVDSPMLIQLIANENKMHVLEFSARTGGGVKYIMVKKASGFDVIDAVIDLTEGKKPTCNVAPPESKYIVNEFIYCKDGIFESLDGFDEMVSQGVISDYYFFKWKGCSFDGVNSSGDRIAGYTLQADSLDELRQKHNKVNQSVRVLDTNGNDIMRHDLLGTI